MTTRRREVGRFVGADLQVMNGSLLLAGQFEFAHPGKPIRMCWNTDDDFLKAFIRAARVATLKETEGRLFFVTHDGTEVYSLQGWPGHPDHDPIFDIEQWAKRKLEKDGGSVNEVCLSMIFDQEESLLEVGYHSGGYPLVIGVNGKKTPEVVSRKVKLLTGDRARIYYKDPHPQATREVQR